MRKTTKRLLSLLLVLCMVMGMLPIAALAANNEEDIPLIAGENLDGTARPDDSGLGETSSFPRGDESADAIGEMRDKNEDDLSIPSDGELQEIHFYGSTDGDTTVTLTGAVETDSGLTRYTVLLLDCSGSMSGTPITRMRAAAKKFCEQVLQANGTNYVAIVSFSDSIKATTDFTDDLTTLETAIDRYSANGGTDITRALKKADELLSETADSTQTVRNVLLLSDGLPENGENNYDGRYTELYPSMSRYYRYANVCYETAVYTLHPKYSVYTLGFFHSLSGESLEFGTKLMEDLANKNHYIVNDPDDLDFFFGEVADDMTNPEDVVERKFSFPGQKKVDIEETCWYSDSYFFGDASEYRDDLATMSLCLELSSFAKDDFSYVDEYGATEEQAVTLGWTTDVSAQNARFRNARDLLLGKNAYSDDSEKVAEEYSGLGFENFAVNDFWAAKPTKDSIGAVAASKSLTDSDGNEYTLIALAVRGGGYQQEWASNFTVGKTGDHQGFTEAKNNVLAFLKSYIQNNHISGAIKLWLVGYSRAGVTANMLAGQLDDNAGTLPNVTLAKKDLYVYTFEAPQGALRENFKNANNYKNIHNIINLNDLVPLVAPSSWGFARYNSDEKLPSAFTYGDSFGALQEIMLKKYGNIEDTKAYKIQEYVTQSRLKLEWNKWGILGYPRLYTEDYDVATEEMLLESTTFLFDGVVGGRDIYYYDFQAGVREILSLVYGGTLTDLLDEGISSEEFLSKFFNELTMERLWEIVSPMVAFNLDSLSTRKEKVKENVERFVKDVLGDSDLWGTVMFAAGLPDTLVDLLWRTLESTLEDLWENKNTATIQSVGNLIGLIAGGNLFQAHEPAVTLAWLQTRDTNYNGTPSNTLSGSNSYRIIRIDCPVDVTVSDKNGTVAQLIDDKRTEIDGSYILAYVNADGEKIVLLPADTNYTIHIDATGSGEVYYTVEEYDLDTMSTVQVRQYGPIAVETGNSLTASVPALTETEQNSIPSNGSSATYTLADSTGQSVKYVQLDASTTYDVTVAAEETDGVYGLVSGGGSYTAGSFAQVEASPLNETNFAGWYNEDGELVSEDEIYRFAVTKDTALEARFNEVETYQLTVRAESGGTVADTTMYQVNVPAGVQIAMEATANTGYKFSRWNSTEGSFENSLSTSTQFTMPASEVTVTATFTSSEAWVNPFTDVSESDWFYENVAFVAQKGLMVGTSATTFSPNASTTRAMIVTILHRLAQTPAAGNVSFNDVESGQWYTEAVAWASANDIVNGYGDGTFGPHEAITREQMATILSRFADYKGYDISNLSDLVNYTDVNDISDWATTAMRWANNEGIIVGRTANTLVPDGAVTRAEAAAILMRFCQKIDGLA